MVDGGEEGRFVDKWSSIGAEGGGGISDRFDVLSLMNGISRVASMSGVFELVGLEVAVMLRVCMGYSWISGVISGASHLSFISWKCLFVILSSKTSRGIS
jgi:hypothetical protein